MAMPMPPQGAPQPPQGGPPSAPGGASQLVAQIHDGLMKLQDMMAQAKLPEAQDCAALLQGFQAMVEKLGQPEGEGEEAPEADSGQAPMEAGGNPNARPA